MSKDARKETVRQGLDPELLLRLMPTAALFTSLRELVMTAGELALRAVLEEDRNVLCGPRYQHQEERQAHRSGHTKGSLVLGGRKVMVQRPRAHTEGGKELELPSWKQFRAEDPLVERATEQMLVGVSTRKYVRSLEAVPQELDSHSTSRSAVSRRFVQATEAQLAEWFGRDLKELDLVAMMIDGIHVDEHVILVALGIDSTGAKHVLGFWEGATESATACKAMLADLCSRGLRTDRTMLLVIDGSPALAAAIRAVFGKRALIQRCQAHKLRNVADHLPERKRASVKKAMQDAYRMTDVTKATRVLTNLARSLQRAHPGAAASLREGLDETLTVRAMRLGTNLERTLVTTNPIENLNGIIRHVTKRVRRWQSGEMVLRWVGASLNEASKGFRRLKGHSDMKLLLRALKAHDVLFNGGLDKSRKAA